jgi:hypothetical protein
MIEMYAAADALNAAAAALMLAAWNHASTRTVAVRCSAG